ncbi:MULTISPECIES: response regulator transcription factor [Amycolatopsis]|nr:MULTISPECIES: response regulator transcription factor [Amycolatopsis]UJW32926.1 response regulator transcription factor [Saccharothrix sp. AJ9571]MBN6037081.1 response regulator transcription factor [Amycolatopsis sp. 195334CR]MBP2181155.1 DNA-binding response OmpR family regulator [Amycolatopsis magusensis]MDI5974937.1 response regulator transcription factor [Amycolatopsis magusensis]QFU93220.1 Transcriptional regulatory protein TcrA [Amycolatopsis sp. YIM 10]
MRVLVVEDDVRLAEVLSSGLTAEGFDVDVVHDGFDGYWQAREGAHDVVVLDVLLPSISGYTVAKRLRAEEVWTPVLMLTAKDGEYDEADGLDVGADDYLRKPFSFVVLVARLRALARRGATPRPRLLSHGGLSLDPESGECMVNGKQLTLQPRERALLEALLRNRNRVMSKDRLLNAVWGLDSAGDTNLVEVYVSYLRRKIGAARIETIRSLGYRLVDPDA